MISIDQSKIELLGVTGLYLFALFMFMGKAGSYLGLLLMLVAFLLSIPMHLEELKADPVFKVFLVFFVYVVLRVAASGVSGAEDIAEHMELGFDWLSLWFFVFAGFWVNIKRVPVILLLALFGFFGGMVRKMDWSMLPKLLAGGRNWLWADIPVVAIITATIIVGLVVFYKFILGDHSKRIGTLLRFLFIMLLLVIAIQLLIITQSRITWIAFLVALPIVLILKYKWKEKDRKPSRPKSFVVIGIGTLVLMSLVLYSGNYKIVKKRLDRTPIIASGADLKELKTAEEVLNRNSTGIRIQLIRHGIKTWMEKPVFGWGLGTKVTRASKVSGDSNLWINEFGHLHNWYLELLNRLGILGALLFIAAAFFIGRNLVRSFHAGLLPANHLIFIIGTFTILAIWCTSNYRFSSEWRYYFILLASIAYGLGLNSSGSKEANRESGD